MGQIVLDNRGEDTILTFKEKRNKKWHTLERVTIPKNDFDAMGNEVQRVLRKFRPAPEKPA